MWRTTISASAAILVTLCPGAAQSLANGGFEQNPPGVLGWREVGTVLTGPAGASGTANSAQLGPSVGVVLPGGARATAIWQGFDHSGIPGPCVVEFDYRLQPGADAYLEVAGPAGVHGLNLPPSLLFQKVHVRYPVRGAITVSFNVVDVAGGGIAGVFQVDNAIAEVGQVPQGQRLGLLPNWLPAPAVTPREQAIVELNRRRGAAGKSFTSPSGLTASEGDSVHGHVLFSKPWVTWQQVDSTHQGTPRPSLQGIAFRRDLPTTQSTKYTARQLTLEVAMAHADVQAMGTDPALNYAGPRTVVFTSKTVNAPDWQTPPTGVAAAPFDLVVPFDVVWSYDGVDDLLWEVVITDNSGAPYTSFFNYPVDMQSSAGSFQPATMAAVPLGTGCTTVGQMGGPFTLSGSMNNHSAKISMDFALTGAPASQPVTLHLSEDNPLPPGAPVGAPPGLPWPGVLCAPLQAWPRLSASLGTADPGGDLDTTFDNVPYLATLIGLEFYGQAMALDPTQSELPFSLSNGIELELPPNPTFPGVGHLYLFRDVAGGSIETAGPFAGGVVALLSY